MRKRIAHILMSEYSVDSRVTNETSSLSRYYDIEVLCLNRRKENEYRNNIKIKRFGFRCNHPVLTYFFAYIDMFFSNIAIKYDAIHCHDLNSLPIGYLLALVKGVPFIYDSHELWSESKHNNLPTWIIGFAKSCESFFAQRASAVITVSGSIAEHLNEIFSLGRSYVIKNVPSYTHEGRYDLFREELGLSCDKKIFLYQGLMSKSRGVDIIISAILKLPSLDQFSFVFLGEGPYKKEAKRLIIGAGLEKSVFILDAVEQKELLKYTASADVGVHAIDDSCLNHEYCLPNKLFEYINAGLAVVFPDLKEINKIVKQDGIGLTFKRNDAESLSEALNFFILNKSDITRFQEHVNKSKVKYSWSVEEVKLFEIYEEVLNDKSLSSTY